QQGHNGVERGDYRHAHRVAHVHRAGEVTGLALENELANRAASVHAKERREDGASQTPRATTVNDRGEDTPGGLAPRQQLYFSAGAQLIHVSLAQEDPTCWLGRARLRPSRHRLRKPYRVRLTRRLALPLGS